ncbi:MAG TPA: 16S rRNA (cytidine(1402)-2'-O)-methyltransferase [bacterium]|nr:16S rRNA (cytidine(1402)-2'-O)-methyltransferase [bacterium]HPQ65283.1 16S rRNA (cytidine(1402)-2'-O)-methyltransferase [bacterium]
MPGAEPPAPVVPEEKKGGRLYLVATPIGNLEDISPRALRVLKEAAAVAAEDTRTTRRLLARFGLDTPLISYHDHSPPARRRELLSRLRGGEDLALVSEAGTPGFSDPGFRLVRAAVENGIDVVPVPGPSALMSALPASGLPGNRFAFEGFLPARRAARRKRLYRLANEERTLVFFESPRRVRAFLEDAREILGDRPAVLAREMTKRFEEFVRGSISDLLARVPEGGPRGEVVLILGGRGGEPAPGSPDPAGEVASLVKTMNISRMEAIKLVAARRRAPKGEIYRAVHGTGADR